MKKHLTFILLTALCVTTCFGCGKAAESVEKDTAPKKATIQHDDQADKDDFDAKDHVEGLDEEVYAVEKSEDIDLSVAFKADETVAKIEVDDSNVDYATTGEYKAVCTVTPADKDIKPVEEDIEVKVVTAEEGQKLADEGKTVVASKGEVLKKADDADDSKEETEDKEDKEDKKSSEDSKSNDTKKETSSNSSSQASTSASSSSSSKPASTSKPASSSSSSASKPAAPAHTHSWVAITKQEPVYENQPVYEEQPVYEWVGVCNACGMIRPSRDHIFWEMENNGRGDTSTQNVQTGTKTVQVGTKKVQTGTKTVTVGYKCSGCGATK